jgi:hypothetical protein
MKITTDQIAASFFPRAESRGIRIGDRVRGRRRTLQATTRPESQVTIAACGSCGVPNKIEEGIVIAQCGCNGGAARAFATSAGAAGGPGSLVANPYPDPMPGCYPRSLCDARSMRLKSESWAEMLRRSRMEQMPYEDPYYDSVWMDEIFSAVTTVTAGSTVNIELQPDAGTFALFYYEVIAVDPTTQVQQVDWRAARPRVEGCPVPCSSGDVAALAQFVMKVPEGCAGRPLVAWLDERSKDVPLSMPFTNNQGAGDLSVQLHGIGYCCNERIC